MVNRGNYATRIPHLYASVRELRTALDAPDILEGTRLYDTLKLYSEEYVEEELYGVADFLETRSQEAHDAAISASWEISRAVSAVATGEREATDMEWKNSVVPRIKALLDEFLAIPPSAGVNGGRRRKTRKGKGKSRKALRRARYSRRR